METLKNKTVSQWLRGGPEGDIVLSSRVRLARNIAKYPFLSRAGAQQVARIEEILRNKIQSGNIEPHLQYYRLDSMDPLELNLLVERHLIARDHAESDLVRGVAFSENENLSIMVNEEDHLRIQAIYGGLRLSEAAETVLKVDDLLGEQLPYAFSADFGYLTACPTNVGTAMRASVMLHLPAIIMSREMDGLTRICEEMDLALRGLYGEGTHGAADIYQISNNTTLGISEQEITDHIAAATERIVEMERNIRSSLLKQHGKELRGRITKAFDLLCCTKSISSEEALNLLSQVRMGAHLGLIEGVSESRTNELLLLTLPAHLQTIVCREDDRVKRNEMRASYLREHLTTTSPSDTKEA